MDTPGSLQARIDGIKGVRPLYSVQRLFRAARENFGVKITYQRPNQPYLGAGEFGVEDWGVFNRTRVRQFLED